MRFYGEIIRYGDYNEIKNRVEDYGFIKSVGDELLPYDGIFFHKSGVLCEINELKAGNLVSFEVHENCEGKISAQSINLLKNEDDLILIDRCNKNPNLKVWLSVLKQYSNHVSLAEGIDFTENKLMSKKLNGKIDIGNYIPMIYIMNSKFLRSTLNKKNKLVLYSKILKLEKDDSNFKKEITDELEDLIKLNDFSESDLHMYLPKEIFVTNKYLRNKITKGKLFNIIISLPMDQKINEVNLINFLKEYSYDDKLINKIPQDILKSFVWEKLPPRVKLFNYINNNLGNIDFDTLKILIDDAPKNKYSEIILQKLEQVYSSETLINNLWDYLPINYKLEKYIDDDKIDILRLIDLLGEASNEFASSQIKRLESEIAEHPEILKYWNPLSLVDYLWDDFNDKVEYLWPNLDYVVKVLFIYRMISEKSYKYRIINNDIENPIVKSLLALLNAYIYNSNMTIAFREFNDFFQDYIVDISWNVDIKLDFDLLLPDCPLDYVDYCEGRAWKRNYDDVVFCPRVNNVCPYKSNMKDSLIVPHVEKKWSKWTLLEVIDSLNIIPSIDGINKPYEYVQKMSGWINRLNEIRSRLKCTSCGKALISNKKYAKNLAAYNSTIFFCDCGDKLNSSVYISHCWACRKIIDSREGNIQIDKYYLCIQCSSGPLKSESYSQGTVCPKCGSKQLVKIRNRNYECSICDHHIHLPALQCLTGNRIREKEYEY